MKAHYHLLFRFFYFGGVFGADLVRRERSFRSDKGPRRTEREKKRVWIESKSENK